MNDIASEIWARHAPDGKPRTAEERAELDKALKTELGKIDDPVLRAHTAAILRQQRAWLYRPERDWRMEKLEQRMNAIEAQLSLVERRLSGE